MTRNGNTRSSRKLTARTADIHVLYEASVQSAEAYIELIERIFKRSRKRDLKTLREDFCGTARLCCEWVQENSDVEAWGVDLNPKVLEWGQKNHIPVLEDNASRVHLLCDDVRTAKTPPVDILIAFNFSYYIFKERATLLDYFKTTYNNMVGDGILFLDMFGGPQAYNNVIEPRLIDDEITFDGVELPPFTYVWEQAKFNQINHHMTCYIHFKFPDGTKKNRAFRYDWRIWTPPELTDLLYEAGYKDVNFYLQRWDDEKDDTDDTFRKRKHYNDLDAWFGYIVAEK